MSFIEDLAKVCNVQYSQSPEIKIEAPAARFGPVPKTYKPPKTTGHRTLTEDEIRVINRIKAKAEEVRELLAWVGAVNDIDRRWFAIGRTDLQKGFMAVIRAVARPETF